MKKIIYILLLLTVSTLAQDIGGSGTSGDPYILYNASDVDSIKVLGLNGKYYKLVNDIDMSSLGYYVTPNRWSSTGTTNFGFDGDGHTIKNMNINSYKVYNSQIYTGLIGWIDGAPLNGYIKNIIFDSCTINISANFSCYIGFASGYYKGSGTAISSNIIVKNSSITVTQSGSFQTNFVGLISGSSNRGFTECGVENNIVSLDNTYANTFGGITSTLEQTLSKCYSINNSITVVTGFNRDGLIGGLVGNYYSTSDIEYSYAHDNYYNVSGSIFNEVGGIMGEVNYQFSQPISDGQVYAVNNNMEDVTGSSRVGAFIGRDDGTPTVIFDSSLYFADVTSYTQPDTVIGSTRNAIIGEMVSVKTSTQLKSQSTFIGWDFTTTWAISPSVNSGYPYLKWAYPFALLTPILNSVYTKPDSVDISWIGDSANIYYSLNGGDTYALLVDSVTSPYYWNFPDSNSQIVRIKIESIASSLIQSESDNFTIYGTRYIKILSPLSLGSVSVGNIIPISIQTFHIDSLDVQYSLDSLHWTNICENLKTDTTSLDTLNCNWTITYNISDSIWIRAIEVADTNLYSFPNQTLTSVGTDIPPNPAICWTSYGGSPVQFFSSVDVGCGWVSGLIPTGYITRLSDKATNYNYSSFSCPSCATTIQDSINQDIVTVAGVAQTAKEFYTTDSVVIYHGRRYYTASDSTLRSDDLVNGIDSILVISLKPYIGAYNNNVYSGWGDVPKTLQIYNVQRSKIEGQTFSGSQVFENLNDADFKPQILIYGEAFGHGSLTYKIDALKQPSIVSETSAVFDAVKLGSSIVNHRDYFRGIHPKIRKD